jgi:hypothetical protein
MRLFIDSAFIAEFVGKAQSFDVAVSDVGDSIVTIDDELPCTKLEALCSAIGCEVIWNAAGVVPRATRTVDMAVQMKSVLKGGGAVGGDDALSG